MSKNTREDLQKAGHYEIHGETIAKFEFFENGFNPYSRYLDVDKVDLILRKKENGLVRFVEVQVKYITLYTSPQSWETEKHCWRFFGLNEFEGASPDLYIALVLSFPGNYQGDIFIFPAQFFHSIVNQAVRNNSKKGGQIAKFMIAYDARLDRWFLLTKSVNKAYKPRNGIDLTVYRRNFNI